MQHPFQLALSNVEGPSAHGLACDGVSVHSIVASVGTPAYIYSASAIRDAYRAIDEAFGAYPHAIHYALKANSTLGLVRLLKALGSRADANSAGEIEVALRAGFAPGDIVFTVGVVAFAAFAVRAFRTTLTSGKASRTHGHPA